MTDLFSGEVDDDIKFDYESNTVIDASCASSLEGEMFILGGWNHARQVNSEKSTESRPPSFTLIHAIRDERTRKLFENMFANLFLFANKNRTRT